MIGNEIKLKKVSTYARGKRNFCEAVYKQIEKGELCVIKIDGIKFKKTCNYGKTRITKKTNSSMVERR
jgi:hypothetical protein